MSIQLTPSQMTVFNHVINGFSNKYISQLMGVSESTVKTHCTAIYVACEVESRSELIAGYYKGRIFVEPQKEST